MWKPYHSLSIISLCQSFTNFTTPLSRRTFMFKSTTALTSPPIYSSNVRGNTAVTQVVSSDEEEDTICLGFTGDIMIGRGIDAILPHRVNGILHESYMRHADGYVSLAIQQNGALSRDEIVSKGSNYIWGGDLVSTFQSMPDMMIVNLETSLTTSTDYAKAKGIHYRAHPLNVQSLNVFGADSIITLANNHVLDWGETGLKETIDTLRETHIKYAGAGYTLGEAMKPTLSMVKNKKVAVVAVGLPSAGVPIEWKAGTKKCGVYVEKEATSSIAQGIMENFQQSIRRSVVDEDEEGEEEDVIKIISIHMGPNWNMNVPKTWRDFAHVLIDNGADFVIAHSSHHVKGIEVYKNKMISYGLGDFLNDYEGITGQGYERYRQDLTCLYLPRINKSNGELLTIDIIPCQIKNLKVQRTRNQNDIEWLCNAFSMQGKELGTSCEQVKDVSGDVHLRIHWNS